MALYNITTKEEFDEKVLKSNKLVLIDFWAAWCPPCRAMAPALNDIGKDNDDLIDIVKVDIEATEENQSLAIQHGVQSIPNMPLFYDGQEVHRIIGLVSKNEIINIASNVLQPHQSM
jgi:thioredoxin 1